MTFDIILRLDFPCFSNLRFSGIEDLFFLDLYLGTTFVMFAVRLITSSNVSEIADFWSISNREYSRFSIWWKGIIQSLLEFLYSFDDGMGNHPMIVNCISVGKIGKTRGFW
jgi:hypothetical protein